MKNIRSFRARLITMMMVFTFLFSYVSTPAFAASVDVENLNPVSAGKTAVSGLTIDGVSNPVPGQRLDVSAVVHSKEGHSWEIAVIWLSSNGQVATIAKAGETYYPTLAFYLPQKYGMADGKFKLSVPDSVTKLMGSDELISVYDSKNGITYILSGVAAGKTANAQNTLVSGREDNAKKVRDEFETLSSQQSEVSVSSDSHASGSSDDADADNADDDADDDDDGDDSEPEPELSVIDIYCAQSARDSMTTDDLESVIDLIVNKLQPQAVELLKDSFPAFKSAEENGELGSEIGLYIYYKKGDDDGKSEHVVPGMEELAYVSGDVTEVDGELKYGYIMAVNLESMVRKDKNKKPIIDSNGRYRIVFEGEDMDTMTYTIVHEMFHAFMDDYNRTGMAGGINIADVKTDEKGNLLTDELGNKYAHFHFPQWFIEGTASMTENDYEFRYETFDKLRTNNHTGNVNDYFDKDTLLDSYVRFVNKDGSETYFALPFAVGGVEIKGKEVETDTSRYVSGYLASIYLSELAYRSINDTGAEKEINAKSSARYREGLNWILESLHNGIAFDDIIYQISPTDENGKKIYNDATDFGEKFIEGPAVKKNDQETYYGDPESMDFTLAYLNYLREVDHDKSRKNGANGSVLFDLDVDMSSPLDKNKEATSDSFKIVKTKDRVISTVKSDTIEIGAGKSSLGDWEKQQRSKDKPALAAKTKKTEVKASAKTNIKETETKTAQESSVNEVSAKKQAPVSEEKAAPLAAASALDTTKADSSVESVQTSAEKTEAAPQQTALEKTEETPAQDAAKQEKAAPMQSTLDEAEETPAQTVLEETEETSAQTVLEETKETSEQSSLEEAEETPSQTAAEKEEAAVQTLAETVKEAPSQSTLEKADETSAQTDETAASDEVSASDDEMALEETDKEAAETAAEDDDLDDAKSAADEGTADGEASEDEENGETDENQAETAEVQDALIQEAQDTDMAQAEATKDTDDTKSEETTDEPCTDDAEKEDISTDNSEEKGDDAGQDAQSDGTDEIESGEEA